MFENLHNDRFVALKRAGRGAFNLKMRKVSGLLELSVAILIIVVGIALSLDVSKDYYKHSNSKYITFADN